LLDAGLATFDCGDCVGVCAGAGCFPRVPSLVADELVDDGFEADCAGAGAWLASWRLLPLPEVLSDEEDDGFCGPADVIAGAGAFDDCPWLVVGGRLPFLDCELSPDGVTTVGDAAGATVCAGAFDDCPRLELGGRLLFLDCELSPDGVTTVGGVVGATVCAGAFDDCP